MQLFITLINNYVSIAPHKVIFGKKIVLYLKVQKIIHCSLNNTLLLHKILGIHLHRKKILKLIIHFYSNN